MPALVQSVKSSGLVLVSQGATGGLKTATTMTGGGMWGGGVGIQKELEGVDGVLNAGEVLEFEETIEM